MKSPAFPSLFQRSTLRVHLSERRLETIIGVFKYHVQVGRATAWIKILRKIRNNLKRGSRQHAGWEQLALLQIFLQISVVKSVALLGYIRPGMQWSIDDNRFIVGNLVDQSITIDNHLFATDFQKLLTISSTDHSRHFVRTSKMILIIYRIGPLILGQSEQR